MIPLDNLNQQIGSGVIGEFEMPLKPFELLSRVKSTFGGQIRYTTAPVQEIRSLALCGGSGSFLLENAIASGADAFISSDFKYHQFFDAPGRIFLLDIGHYEGEQFTMNLIHDFLIEKFPKFAARQSERSTNPVLYF
jgi:putative NIF3 family GTP cyclohydrolase 1 type 2